MRCVGAGRIFDFGRHNHSVDCRSLKEVGRLSWRPLSSERGREFGHFALKTINGWVDLQTLALDEVLFPAHQFCKWYSLIATNTTARMEVIQQVKALANI
jgi:hypothetical protein